MNVPARVVDTQTLTAAVKGTVVRPGDSTYDSVRAIWNAMIDRRPAVVVRCAGATDVAAAIGFARERGLEISIRGGGHNIAGTSVCDGGVMIDLSQMRQVRVDAAARRAFVEPGALLADVDRATVEHGLATPLGINSTTGVAGLTLGGGFGWLTRVHGMTVDNLVSADVVGADGTMRRASASENPDLFWAVRGGGGNFGVVTAFEFRVHPVDTVLGGIVAYPMDDAVNVVEQYRDHTDRVADELTAFLGLVHAPDGSGTKLVAVPLCHCGGDFAAAEAEVRPLQQFGSAVVDTIDRIPYPAINTMLDAAFPRGTLNYWKSAFLRELTLESLHVLVEAFAQCPSPLTSIVIAHYHGATSRVAPTDTAFPHRGPGFSPVILTQWTDPADTQANVAWTQETFAALRPHTEDRVYVNNLSADDAGFVPSAYGANWQRLVELKRRYDPDNVFHINHNIDPLA